MSDLRLLTQFALWFHPTWDKRNVDDCAQAALAAKEFLAARGDASTTGDRATGRKPKDEAA